MMRTKMRIYFGLIALIFLGATSCFRGSSPDSVEMYPKVSPRFNIKTVEEFYDFLTFAEGSYPLVSAHRGGGFPGYPENSIASFAKIAKEMPAIIECDVRITKDSVLVLMHDETLNRTTTGKGKVINKTYAELEEYKLKDSEGKITRYGIPTLEQALLWGKNAVIYTLDVKKEVPYAMVVDLIHKTQTETNTIIITYSANQAAVVNKLAPDLMISASIKKPDDLTRLSNLDIPDNKLVAFVGTSEPDSSLYSALRLHGIKSILGTIGNLDRSAAKAGYQVYAEYINRGADILSTDRPFEAAKALDFYIKKRNIRSKYIQ
ncbi:glycerophosphodiester phosphodiesterase family protein [Sphingobacteruim zhuxiongii]|nr:MULTISPECIES: glycerophosphodiester phosphodiesterase family protein [unclassified Sphingobacterium]